MDGLLEILVNLIISLIEGAAKRRTQRQLPQPQPPARLPQTVRARPPVPPARPPAPQPPKAAPAPPRRIQPGLAAVRARRQPAPAPRALLTAETLRDAVILDAILTRR